MAKANSNSLLAGQEINVQYAIAVPFRDKFDYSIEYQVDQAANFDAERTKQLLELGLIKLAE